MNNAVFKIIPFVTFATGAVIGSVATWFVVKTKYEQIAQEEIDSVKEVFSKIEPISKEQQENVDTDDIQDKSEDKLNATEYTSKLNECGYIDYSTSDKAVVKEKTLIIEENIFDKVETERKTMGEEKPYVISPEEFGELDDYDKISLTYYSDQILTSDNDELVEDVERVVGFDSLNHFGEYEDDSVFVRNDRLKVDFEILKDLREYTDVLKEKPYKRASL